MKKKAIIIGLMFSLALFFLSTPSSAKPIKVLAQFPMSGPVGSLPEFGWGFIDGTS
ncbi:MAG: hypothetical protein QME78_12300 [Thermodesulfobacteriota bacterium]|nr:hypothetical protein [Thermodesulfobacteriota bacterium]